MMTLLTWIAASAMVMHPAQETLCELSWNAQTNRLEVSLRLSQLDERHLLGTDASRLRADEKAFQTAATLILQDQLSWGAEDDVKRFVENTHPTMNRPEAHSPLGKYHWLGRQSEGAHVWWHFEYETNNQHRPTHVGSRLLPYLRDISPSAHQHAGALSTFIVLNANPENSGSPKPNSAGPGTRASVTMTEQRLVGKIPW